jgi:hypothetical protein
MFKKVMFIGIGLFFVLSGCLFSQTVVKDDFRVNDDYDIGGSNQSYPAIAMDNAGNFVVVWLDERNGGMDIYGQRFDHWGNPLGENFKVNDMKKEGKYIGYNFGVAMGANGDFVVVWQDNRNNNYDIYAQKYDFTGSPIGSNFKVNDDPGFSSQTSPAVTMNPSGEFVAVWLDNKDRDFSIYGQRYLSSGEAMGSNFKITSFQMSKIDLFPPDVAIDPKGDFVVTWSAVVYDPETSKDYHEIHAIRVNAKNEILSSEFKVNDSDSTAVPFNPDVAVDAPGNFVITWMEKRTESQDVYAQRYNFKGEALGCNFRVDEVTGRFFKASPKVAMTLSKKFIISWLDSRDRISGIYLQHYNQFGEPEGGNIRVADGEFYPISSSDIAKTPSSYLALTWEGYRCSYDRDIFSIILDQKGEIVKEGFKVNDDSGSSSQNNPAIAASPSGRFTISWDDRRLCETDIFFQIFNSSGEFLGSNLKVNQESYETRFTAYSSNSMDSSGNSVIAFSGYYGTFFQRYDSNGQKSGDNTRVNENFPVYWEPTPDVSMNPEGAFVVVWDQKINSLPQMIFAQLFDFQGNKVNSNFIVNSFIDTTQYSHYPKVATTPSGNLVMVWQSSHQIDYESEIWGQSYNPSGEKIGENFRISDSSVSRWNSYPDVGMDKDGNFVVAWSIGWNILIQRFKADGSKIGEVIEAIGHVKTKTDKISLAVKSSGEFIVAWSDFRNVNWDIYAQRFDADGNPLGGNFRVNNDQGDNIQQSPVVATDDKNYYFAWVDNRNSGSGFDIFCKVISFEPTFVSDEELLNKPEYILLQNYPNPFNPTTTISFKVKSLEFGVGRPIHTTLIIYNLLGQKVKILVDEDKLSGRYQVSWDGKNEEGNDVSSGIYFYVIKTKDFTQTKKMTLVR